MRTFDYAKILLPNKSKRFTKQQFHDQFLAHFPGKNKSVWPSLAGSVRQGFLVITEDGYIEATR